jgi:hypothetical protein
MAAHNDKIVLMQIGNTSEFRESLSYDLHDTASK